jgi:hypothetical protein
MFRAQNKKVKIANSGTGYELFWVADNAAHVAKRAAHHSHLIDLVDVDKFASIAFYLNEPITKGVNKKSVGLGKYKGKFYMVVVYFVTSPSRRCIVESCHIVNTQHLLAICKEYEDILPQYNG